MLAPRDSFPAQLMFEAIKAELTDRIIRVHGEKGRQWLRHVAALIAECETRWSLELDNPFAELSYNLVIPGRTATGDEIVLKLGVPCRELTTEALALRCFAGDGAVVLIDSDTEIGALLLQRVVPGTFLHESLSEESSIVTAAALMRRLWRDPDNSGSFPTLPEWFSAFDRFQPRDNETLAALLENAKPILRDLLAGKQNNVLLHGDLHHANILFSSVSGWVAIDPKGVLGNRGYEIGPFMLNMIPREAADDHIHQILSKRLSVFARELNTDRKRMARWSFCYSVLSAVWNIEDSEEPAETVRVAQILQELCETGH